MFVLLAEGNVPYGAVFELVEIHNECLACSNKFPTCSVAYVIKANDVTNRAAKTDPPSAIHAASILDGEKAHNIISLERNIVRLVAGLDPAADAVLE